MSITSRPAVVLIKTVLTHDGKDLYQRGMAAHLYHLYTLSFKKLTGTVLKQTLKKEKRLK